MRLILLLLFSLSFSLAATSRAATKINWFDLRVSNIEIGKKFYGDLFGWTFYDKSQGDIKGVGILNCTHPLQPTNCEQLGSMWQMNFRSSCEDDKSPPHCAVFGKRHGSIMYFEVEDTEEFFAKAKSLGAKSYLAPLNIPTPEGVPLGSFGATAIFTDPFGVEIGINSQKPLQK